MIGTGVSNIEVIAHLARAVGPGLSVPGNVAELGALGQVHRLLARGAAQRARVLPHAVTVCVPSATRFSAAWSPSWPETGTEPAMPCAASAATAPPAVPSFDATTASTLLLVGGQELLHVALRVGGQPAIGVGLADLLDLAGIDRGACSTSMLAREQEVGIRIGRRGP